MAFIYNGYNKYFRDLVFIYCGVFAQPCVQRMPITYGVDLVNMEISVMRGILPVNDAMVR